MDGHVACLKASFLCTDLSKLARIAQAAETSFCLPRLYKTGLPSCVSNQIAATIPNLDDEGRAVKPFNGYFRVRSGNLQLETEANAVTLRYPWSVAVRLNRHGSTFYGSTMWCSLASILMMTFRQVVPGLVDLSIATHHGDPLGADTRAHTPRRAYLGIADGQFEPAAVTKREKSSAGVFDKCPLNQLLRPVMAETKGAHVIGTLLLNPPMNHRDDPIRRNSWPRPGHG